jgi:hypothetical protein
LLALLLLLQACSVEPDFLFNTESPDKNAIFRAIHGSRLACGSDDCLVIQIVQGTVHEVIYERPSWTFGGTAIVAWSPDSTSLSFLSINPRVADVIGFAYDLKTKRMMPIENNDTHMRDSLRMNFRVEVQGNLLDWARTEDARSALGIQSLRDEH